MSRTAPDDPRLKDAMEDTGLPITDKPVLEDSPAVADARKILLIVLGAIVVWSAVVHLFVF